MMNKVDNLAGALVDVMKYSDTNIDYPDTAEAKIDDKVFAEWFYPVLNGTNDFSELTAIHMYIAQEAMFAEASELLLGIALTEMRHYDKLSDFCLKIGGSVKQRFVNSGMTVGTTAKEAVQLAIEAEKKTIDYYEKLQQDRLQTVDMMPMTTTKIIASQLVAKLLADEHVHLRLLEEWLSTHAEISNEAVEGD